MPSVITNQSIIVWTLKTKSLLPPFTKGPAIRGIWKRGEIFGRICLINYGLLSNRKKIDLEFIESV